MFRHHTGLAVLNWIILSGIASHAQSVSSAVGMISKTSGEVVIERGTVKTSARLADLLYPGDKISTLAGQVMFVFCPSSERIALMDHTIVELRADGISVLKGTSPTKTAAKCLLPRVALGNESMERMGALRARGELPVSLYLGGSVASERPDFCWGMIKGAVVYRLILRDRGKDAVLWETSSSLPAATYPESMPPLAQGEYEWEVKAEAGGKTLARGAAAFEVTPSSLLSQASETSPEGRLLRAISLENEGYFAEAASFYRDLRATNPEDARLTRHLAWLYWNAGLIVAANEELRRLTAPGVR